MSLEQTEKVNENIHRLGGGLGSLASRLVIISLIICVVFSIYLLVKSPDASLNNDQSLDSPSFNANQGVETNVQAFSQTSKTFTENKTESHNLKDSLVRSDDQPESSRFSQDVSQFSRLENISEDSTENYAPLDSVDRESSFNKVVLSGNQSIDGKILSDSGAPRGNTVFNAYSITRASNSRYSSGIQGKTDKNGAFVVNGLEQGSYRFTVPKSKNFSATSRSIKSGSKSITFVTPELKEMSLSGMVINADSGDPLDDVNVIIAPKSGVVVTTDNDGIFKTNLLLNKETTYHFRFERDGFMDGVISVHGNVLLRPHGQFPIIQSLEPVNSKTQITGVISSTDGLAIANQKLDLVSKNQSTRVKSRSDANGLFTFDDIPTGPGYRLIVMPTEKYEPIVLDDISVDNNLLPMELVLQPITNFAQMTGQVVDNKGNRIPDFELLIKSKKMSQKIQVISDSNGEFSIEVASGPVQIYSRGSPSVIVANLELEKTRKNIINIPVDWGSEVLSGTLVDENGSPIQGVKVSLGWSSREGRVISQTSRTARTDPDGNFTFSNLGSGSHTLSMSKTGYTNKREVVNIDGSPKNIRIEMDVQT